VVRVEGAARVFLGACEGLLTPRTLAPFREMVRNCAGLGGLRTVDEFVEAFLDLMSIAARPAVVIVEDAHWADDASLDVIRCLGRRVARLPALLVVSFRDEELAADHPLRLVVGALVGPRVLHLELPELSEGAVRRLAASAGVDGDAVVGAAGGNPFFVSEVLAMPGEVLAMPGEVVPPSVRHAVLARVCALPRECRSALEQLAVVPAEVADWLVTALVPDRTVLAPAERLGMIVVGQWAVRFRHELARRAVEEAIPGSVLVGLHARVLRALVAVGVDASRVVHHAVAAGDRAAVDRYAGAAAREAAAAGGHREAASLALLALGSGTGSDGEEVARLHGVAATALHALNRLGEAKEHADQAVGWWDATGAAPLELGEALVVSSRLNTSMGEPAAARAAALRAVEVLEPLGAGRALAMGYCTLAGQDVVLARYEPALRWAERALRAAAAAGGTQARARALCVRGIARLALGDRDGLVDQERGVETAERFGHGDAAAVGYYNLAVAYLRDCRPDRAQECLEAAQRVAAEYGLDAVRFSVRAQWGYLLLWRGEWDQADRRLRALLRTADDPGAKLALPLAFLGRLLARRGDGEALALVARAWRLAVATGEQQKMATVGGARIEAAWLAGDHGAVRSTGAELLSLAATAGHETLRGEVLRYLRRVGDAVDSFAGCPPPAAAGIAGDWALAAKLWGAAGNPYEEALELAEAPDPAVALRALGTLDRLGAVPAAAIVRRRLRAGGVQGVPRGPGAATRANPARLTARQFDVLALLTRGHTNAEVAARLHISRRTVDNHVAALFERLGVGSRRAAAAKAADLGLLPAGEHEN
jgi:DNA-binding CsgD family transcriptional regulator/tetratricopeptide (TPR) repeat protein